MKGDIRAASWLRSVVVFGTGLANKLGLPGVGHNRSASMAVGVFMILAAAIPKLICTALRSSTLVQFTQQMAHHFPSW